MRAAYLAIGVIICATAAGQSVAELDKKGGFKEFRIGDTLSRHQDKIKFTKTLDNADTKLY